MRKNGGRVLKRILIAGFSTRHVAVSAHRAGYEVYAIDHFCDADLRRVAVSCARFEELAELPFLIDEMCRKHQIDAIIPTSGVETLRNHPVPVLGTDPLIAERFLDKGYMQTWFEGLDIPIPPLAEEGVFPAMLKPLRGSGGWRNTIVNSEEEVATWRETFPDEPFLLQKIVEGTPASVCCVAGNGKARAIAVNRQIMRGSGPYRYGFSGSLTPFDHPLQEKMVRYAEHAAAVSGCQGVLGIDFMVSDDTVYAIELNPRFVATLDTIESATGVNLVQLHIDACRGVIPMEMPAPVRYAMRRILFADRPCAVTRDLTYLSPHVADIPVPPAYFEEGGAIISVYGEGSDMAIAEQALDTTIRFITQYIE